MPIKDSLYGNYLLESTLGASRTGASRTGASRTGASRTGASRTGASRTGASRRGTSRRGTSRTGSGVMYNFHTVTRSRCCCHIAKMSPLSYQTVKLSQRYTVRLSH